MFVCAWVPVRTCTSDPLKLELIEGKLPDVDAGYWIQVFCKSVLLLTAEPFPLQSLRFKYYAPPNWSIEMSLLGDGIRRQGPPRAQEMAHLTSACYTSVKTWVPTPGPQ